MNLQEQSIIALGIMLAAMPKGTDEVTKAYFDEKRKEIKAEIEKREAADRWKKANELAIANMN